MSEAFEEQEAVAVIGMSGRFPGATDTDQLWRNLMDGVESITRFGRGELDASVPSELHTDPSYVPVRGVLEDAEMFDASFFGIRPREAEIMDPQGRVFLEQAWIALERSGYLTDDYTGLIGVYAGMANNSYYASRVLKRPDLVARFGEFQTMLANEKDFLATRVSHKLDLRGPSVSLYTGCSTSLVAVCHAFHSLMSFQSDIALAGGVCITVPQHSGYLHQEGGIESVDGHCRPFDARATGTIFSNGVGLVVLKRLSEALEDGDHIHAVLRGAALNNDGAAKVSFAAPSVAGQADVIAMALAQGDVDPATVGYVEAHGTATQLGDPVEFEGLKRAFQYPRSGTGYCALGSIKSNFGHLLAAAGVTGLIKAVLALENEVIPPTINWESPNPQIDFGTSPFYLNTAPVPWPRSDAPRRAGVSSFGIGGTNAHVVLEEAPRPQPGARDPRPQAVLLSARSDSALDRMSTNLAAHLGETPDVALDDVAHTLQVGRRRFGHRRMVVAGDVEEAIGLLTAPDGPSRRTRRSDAEDPEIVLMFPGLGTQYPGMGSSLYADHGAFRDTLDRCADTVRDVGKWDLLAALRPDRPGNALDDPGQAHAAVFSTELALARMMLDAGIKPRALVGHSIGEFVAAAIAGVFSAEDALRMILARSDLLRAVPEGGMLAVRLGAVELARRLPAGLSLAADNSPDLSVVAGLADDLTAFAATLEAEGVPSRRLPASRAYHSPGVDSIVEACLSVASEIEYSRPRTPWVSTVTGSWIDPHAATDPTYWARHASQPVEFRKAIQTAAGEGDRVLVEVGAGSMLGTCARQTLGGSGVRAVSTLPDAWEGADKEQRAVLAAFGEIWMMGGRIDWARLHGSGRRRVALPTYPFERTRHWIDTESDDDA